MCITRYSLGHRLFCVVRLYELHHESPGYYSIGATWEWHHGYVTWSYLMATLWLHYGYAMAIAMAAVSGRREAVLWLSCQPGENKRICSSYGSLSLLLASQIAPCLPWVQQTMQTLNRISKTTVVVSMICKTHRRGVTSKCWSGSE